MEIGTHEWLEWRRDKITATDAPVIMGVNPYNTPYQLWMEKKGLYKTPENAAMKRGRDLEPKARQCFERERGISMPPEIFCREGIFAATLDGVNQRDGLEIKCNGEKTHRECVIMDIVPAHHWVQIQWQIFVANLDKVYYYSFDGEKGHTVEVFPDLLFIEKMEEKCRKWHQDHILNNIPPALEKMDEKGSFEIGDLDFDSLCKEYTDLKKKIKAMDERCDDLQKRIIEKCKDKSTQSSAYKAQKMERKGSIDYSQIPEMSGVDLDLYRKENTYYWKISENA